MTENSDLLIYCACWPLGPELGSSVWSPWIVYAGLLVFCTKLLLWTIVWENLLLLLLLIIEFVFTDVPCARTGIWSRVTAVFLKKAQTCQNVPSHSWLITTFVCREMFSIVSWCSLSETNSSLMKKRLVRKQESWFHCVKHSHKHCVILIKYRPDPVGRIFLFLRWSLNI